MCERLQPARAQAACRIAGPWHGLPRDRGGGRSAWRVLAASRVSGIGPFTVQLGIVSDPPGLNVTLSVTNNGTPRGSTACRVCRSGLGRRRTGRGVHRSPRIDPGGTVSFSKQISQLGSSVRPLAVECTGP